MAKKELKATLEDVKLEGYGKWLIVKPVDKESKTTKSGLVRPDNDEDKQNSAGTVVSTGKDVDGISIGDRVLYGVYAGESVEVLEKGKKVEYRFVLPEDVIGFIK